MNDVALNSIGGTKFFNYVLKHNNWQDVIDNEINVDKFHLDDDVRVFKYFDDYYSRYGRTPDEYSVKTMFNDFKLINTDNLSWEEIVDEVKYEDCKYTLHDFLNDTTNVFNKGTSFEEFSDACRNIIRRTSDYFDKTSSQTYTNGVDLCNISTTHFYKPLFEDVVPSGMSGLDEYIGGWDTTSDYAIVAGRPGNGKSMLLCKFAAEALKQGKRVGYYSGEMPCHKIFERVLTALYRISSAAIFKRDKNIEGEYRIDVDNFMKSYGDKFFVTETKDFGGQYPTSTQLGVFAKKCNLDILFVDQLSLLRDQENAKVPFEKAYNISRQLKLMRDKIDIPVVVAVQRNRTKEENNEVSLSSISGSDGIGADATKVIMIEKKSDRELGTTTCTLYVVKNRFGKQGSLSYDVDFDKGRWDEIAKPTETITNAYSNEGAYF